MEAALRRGRLSQGDRLPTVRELADRLSVSPATVAAAYKTLGARGIVEARGRRGTVVRGSPPIAGRGPTPVPAGIRNLAHGNPDPGLLPPLGPGLRAIDDRHVLYGAPLKDEALLRLARRDLERDGIPSEAISVVSGGMDGIERVLMTHVRPGDSVVVEDPGFTSVIDLVASLGLRAVPCAVDDCGPLPAALSTALASGARALIVTPRAQNPTGAAIDASRARELRSVLHAYPDVLLIEDDHAAAVSGARLCSLCDGTRERWAFVRSLSKAFSPDLRLAVVSGDAETIGRVEGRLLMGVRWVSHILQRLAVATWSSRSAASQLKRAERSYATRRAALVDALARRDIRAHARSGLNVWVPVREELPVVQGLARDGWAVAAGERFRLESPPAVRVTVSTLEAGEAEHVADAFARAFSTQGRSTSA